MSMGLHFCGLRPQRSSAISLVFSTFIHTLYVRALLVVFPTFLRNLLSYHNSVVRSRSSATSFPGSSLFLPRESTLVSAGHLAPKIWVLTRMCYRRGVAKYKIVTSFRMVESTGGDVSFFSNICGDKNSFYRQVFLHYIRTFDIEAVHVIFDSEKHVYKFLNFTNHRHSQRKPTRVTT